MPQVIAGQPKISQLDASVQDSDSCSDEAHRPDYRPASGRWVPKGIVLLLVLLVVGVVNACAYQINAEKYAHGQPGGFSSKTYNGSSIHPSPCFWLAPRQARGSDDLYTSGASHEDDLAQTF